MKRAGILATASVLAGAAFVATSIPSREIVIRLSSPRTGAMQAVVSLPEHDPKPELWWHVIYDQGAMRRSAWFPPGTTGDVRLPADCWLREREQPVVAGFWKDSPEGGVECCGEDARVEEHVVDRFEGACE